MEAYSYAQTSPISVHNFHFQKAPLPSSFTRFAHKNFFSTEIIHTHVDLFSGWKMDNLDLSIFTTEFRSKSMDYSDLFIFPDPITLLAPCHQQLHTTNAKHPAWSLSREALRGVQQFIYLFSLFGRCLSFSQGHGR